MAEHVQEHHRSGDAAGLRRASLWCGRVAAGFLAAAALATVYVVVFVPDDTNFTGALKVLFVGAAMAMLIVALGLWLGQRTATLMGVVGSLFGLFFTLNFGSEGVSIADSTAGYRDFLDRAAWLIGTPFPFVLALCVGALGLDLAGRWRGARSARVTNPPPAMVDR